MIDFHSHILPDTDDGARDMDTSMIMLSESLKQGIDTVVSTSHCYPENEEKTEAFIKKRDARLAEVRAFAEENGIGIPDIIPAAEVNLLTDISEYSCLDRLCIGDTNYMLVEMTWTPWTSDSIDRVYNLIVRGFRPIMAHIERFGYQDPALLEELYSLDVLYQINAENILDKKMCRHIRALWERGLVHIIGSDMHGSHHRPQTVPRAADEICRRFSEDHLEYLMKNGDAVLSGGNVDKSAYRRLPKLSFMSRVFGI